MSDANRYGSFPPKSGKSRRAKSSTGRTRLCENSWTMRSIRHRQHRRRNRFGRHRKSARRRQRFGHDEKRFRKQLGRTRRAKSKRKPTCCIFRRSASEEKRAKPIAAAVCRLSIISGGWKNAGIGNGRSYHRKECIDWWVRSCRRKVFLKTFPRGEDF